MKNVVIVFLTLVLSQAIFAGDLDLNLVDAMNGVNADGLVINNEVVSKIENVYCSYIEANESASTCRFETEIEADIDEVTTLKESLKIVGTSAAKLSQSLLQKGAESFISRRGAKVIRLSKVECRRPFPDSYLAEATTCNLK